MKRLLFAVTLALVSAAWAKPNVSKTGGMLRLLPKDAGTFLVVNAQEKVAVAVLEKMVRSLLMSLDFDVRVVGGSPVAVKDVPESLKKLNARGALWVVDDPELPISLSAAEDGWAIVNIAPIDAGADKQKTETRLRRAALRAFASLFDIGDSDMMPGCVMRPSHGVAGLDALTCDDFSPQALNKLQVGIETAGFKFANAGTYLDACEEGWAPAPTNDVQRAIWDKVHALPTAPIKILPKNQREKKRE